MAKILIIEDDENIASQVKKYLEDKKFEVWSINNFSSALKKMNGPFDLALLDINLPDGQGIELLGQLKKRGIRVIITTVKNDERFIVEALDKGADDYLTKPFHLSVLRARIDACLRTLPVDIGNKISHGDCTLDLVQGVVCYQGDPVDLGALEFQVLSLFLKNPNRIFTREYLLQRFWEDRNQFVNDNTLTRTIKRIRGKTSPSIIKTVRGIGYRMDSL